MLQGVSITCIHLDFTHLFFSATTPPVLFQCEKAVVSLKNNLGIGAKKHTKNGNPMRIIAFVVYVCFSDLFACLFVLFEWKRSHKMMHRKTHAGGKHDSRTNVWK